LILAFAHTGGMAWGKKPEKKPARTFLAPLRGPWTVDFNGAVSTATDRLRRAHELTSPAAAGWDQSLAYGELGEKGPPGVEPGIHLNMDRDTFTGVALPPNLWPRRAHPLGGSLNTGCVHDRTTMELHRLGESMRGRRRPLQAPGSPLQPLSR